MIPGPGPSSATNLLSGFLPAPCPLNFSSVKQRWVQGSPPTTGRGVGGSSHLRPHPSSGQDSRGSHLSATLPPLTPLVRSENRRHQCHLRTACHMSMQPAKHWSPPPSTPTFAFQGGVWSPGVFEKQGLAWFRPRSGTARPAGAHVPRHLWRPPFLIFPLIHGPHSPLDVLHADEAFMQAEVVAHGILGIQ